MSGNGWDVALRGRMGALELDVLFETEGGPTVIVGPNGSGKTTLLRAIAGADLPLRGRVSLAGRALLDSERGLALAPEDRRVGYVPQGFGLFPHLSVRDNVAFGGGKGASARARADATLDRLDAGHLGPRRPATLSGGEQQRVALARAVAIEPAGLLLDEPLSALDAGSRRSLRAFLGEHLRRAAIPALVVTHDARDVLALGTDVIVLEAGRVVARGSARDLASAPPTEFVRELLGPLPSPTLDAAPA